MQKIPGGLIKAKVKQYEYKFTDSENPDFGIPGFYYVTVSCITGNSFVDDGSDDRKDEPAAFNEIRPRAYEDADAIWNAICKKVYKTVR